MRRPRLGLFGGSFDPVHVGHILLARWAREALGLDELWLVPQAASADGKKLSSMVKRWRALDDALSGEEGLRACDVDLRLGGISRTVETLRQLRYELGPQPEFTWILGQDQALRLPQWQEADELPGLARFAYFKRAGCTPVPKRIHSRFHCAILDCPGMELSSTWIRQQRQAGKTPDLAQVS
jgi:nicotinate-nucleotide adenylyltransferase